MSVEEGEGPREADAIYYGSTLGADNRLSHMYAYAKRLEESGLSIPPAPGLREGLEDMLRHVFADRATKVSIGERIQALLSLVGPGKGDEGGARLRSILRDFAREVWYNSELPPLSKLGPMVEKAAQEIEGGEKQEVPARTPGADAPTEPGDAFDKLKRRVAFEVEAIAAQRETILRAFIAEYGFNPAEAEQVIQHTEEGAVFFVRRKNPAQSAPKAEPPATPGERSEPEQSRPCLKCKDSAEHLEKCLLGRANKGGV